MSQASIGFFHQLGVLLWKNWTIKKRHVWVTVFELLTPLVLFLILVGLRKNEPIKILGGTNFAPRPLPSSGMVAVLQEFCPRVDSRDMYGYPIYKNNTASKVLDDIHSIWLNSRVLGNYTSPSAFMLRFNSTWANITSASHIFDNNTHYEKANDLHVYQILNNPTSFGQYLKHHYNLSQQQTSDVLKSTVNLKAVLNSLTTPSLSLKSRQKRSLAPFDKLQIPFSPITPLIALALYSYPGVLSKNLTKVEKLQQRAKLEATKRILLSPEGLRYMMCYSPYPILISPSNSTSLKSTHSKLCQSQNISEFQSLSNELLPQINNTAILNALANISNVDTNAASKEYRSNLKAILKELEEFYKFTAFMDLMVNLAVIVPNNSCPALLHDGQTTTAMPETFTNSTYQDFNNQTITSATSFAKLKFNGTVPPIKPPSDVGSKKETDPDYLTLWAVAQPVLCGRQKGTGKSYHHPVNSSNIRLTRDQKHDLGILIHVLTSNPKILYAPNNTQVESVIQKANTSFAIIDNITKALDLWMNISKHIREGFNDPEVLDLLTWLSELKQMYKEKPILAQNLTAGQPELQRFLVSNASVPNKTEIVQKLDIIENAGCAWNKWVNGISINWFKGFPSEEDAVKYATEQAYHDNASVFATLIFEVDEDGNIPPHITYKIRQNASFTQDTKSIRLSYWRPDPFAWDMRYYTFGFVWIQDLIERSLIWEYVGHEVVSPGAYLHEMPYPCFRFDAFAMNLGHIMPLAMVISWVYTVAMFVQHIVYEKEQRLKEVMKIMGLSNGVHWLAWFISIFLQLEITVTVISLLVKFGSTAILPNSDFFIIWLFFTIYAAATIMFCFLVSVLFSKAKVASACSGILYFMSYLPFAYMSIQEFILHQSIPAVVKSAASLLSTTAFGLGAKYFAVYELSGYGIQWDNIAQTPIEGDEFSLWQAMYMLMIDIIVYAMLTWYIEAVFPGQYGLPRPWYFPLTKDNSKKAKKLGYWVSLGELYFFSVLAYVGSTRTQGYLALFEIHLQIEKWGVLRSGFCLQVLRQAGPPQPVDRFTLIGNKSKVSFPRTQRRIASLGIELGSYWMGHGETESVSLLRLWKNCTQRRYLSLVEEDQAAAMDVQNSAEIEPEPTHLELGIRIEKLTKIYKKGGKKAVDNLSLNFYQDQITSFLGHNGAGKTTTMSILTGLFPPTSGTAYIYGQDIRSEMLDIRKSLGMCPQHNALFEVLTVEEHLWFYARLKGVASGSIMKDMDQFLDDVGLSSKRFSKVNTLSGGMKRKLSVAIAFVGGSRTVILDEPTAGVDPYARRAIWDLIIKYKEGRTILLSTHHMDEADLLGDRIAIITNGKLQCCGSPLFLKSTYGEGYNLTLLKKVNQTDDVISESSQPTTSLSTEENKIEKFVHRHVSSATISSQSPNHISFNLPVEAARKGCFHKLFKNLPENMSNLRVTGYGLTDTTLEEVFLKVDTTHSRCDSEASSMVEKERKYLSLENEPSQDTSSSSPSDYAATSEDVPLEHEMKVGSSSAPNTGSNAMNTEYTYPQVSGCPTASDSNIALEWLQSAPDSADFSKEMGPTFPEGNCADEETLLMNYAFGDSSFFVPVEKPSGTETIGNVDDNDLELQNIRENAENQERSPISVCGHNLRILQGLLVKRFHYARRSPKAVFYQIMLPALFVCIAMTVALSLPKAGDPPPLVLSPSQYYNMTRPRGNFIPFTDQSVMHPVELTNTEDADPLRLIDTFDLPSGVGATCVLNSSDSQFDFDFNNTTLDSLESGTIELVLKHFNPECGSCFTKGHVESQFLPPINSRNQENVSASFDKDVPCTCSKDGNTYTCAPEYEARIDQLKTTTVVTGDKLIEITGKEPILPYLRYTTNKYRLHRYGAFSFGEVRESINKSFPGWPSPLRKLAVRDAAQIYFNHKGFHAMATYLNVFNNALLRANLPFRKGTPAAYGITAINHPMNKTAGALSVEFLVSGTDVIIAIFVIVAMSFVPASFLVFLVAEKQNKAKHLQFISGTGPVTYWLSNYIWDMLNYLFPAILCISILQIFDLPAYTRGYNAYAVVALFLLYGWSMTPMMYPASFYFEVPSTAYVCLIVLNLFVGITTVVATFMISVFRDDDRLRKLNEKLQVAFLIFPNYNLGKGLMDLSYYEYMNDYYTKIGEEEKIRHPFEWDIITRQLVAMGIEGVVGFLVTLLFEVRFFARFGKSFIHTPPTDLNHTEDVDVANERCRVENLRKLNRRDDLIVVDNISKIYRKKLRKTVAVNGVSFSVARGECFGLLGVNGAGKTTTFCTITGACEVNSGAIRVAGHTITGGRSHERLKAQQSTGYCPQFDSLFNELTPTEHLLLYARLRGVPRKKEKQVVDWAIKKLDLTRHEDQPVQDLSGGNRRKLSVAIALVGDPPVVLLDEPTTGMDPAARRFLWDLILDVTKSGRAVLLTSHSMEECEVLCSRIAIMVNGKFKCLGPTQHLKNRFGDGYMVSVRSSQPSLFVAAFQEKFPSAILKEQHYHKAVFQLSISDDPLSNLSLAEVFEMLEDRRQELKIEDYSVSQTTLDDVFINFAKKQGNSIEENPPTKSWYNALRSWVSRLLSRRRNGSSLAVPIQSSDGSSFPSIRTGITSIEEDLDSDTQPLYDFDQDMSLSFIDSTF